MSCRLISISGAAGTGKSTLLNAIQKQDDLAVVDDFKVARSVLSQLGKSLNEILTDYRQVINFQEMILEQKIEHDSGIKFRFNASNRVYVERCPADFIAFVHTWSKRIQNPVFDSWIKSYEARCFDSMSIYDVSFILPPGHFDHFDDGVRAGADTQDDTHNHLCSFLGKFWGQANFSKPKFFVHEILSRDIINRISELTNTMDRADSYLSQDIHELIKMPYL